MESPSATPVLLDLFPPRTSRLAKPATPIFPNAHNVQVSFDAMSVQPTTTSCMLKDIAIIVRTTFQDVFRAILILATEAGSVIKCKTECTITMAGLPAQSANLNAKHVL